MIDLTVDQFRHHLGESFRLHADAGVFEVKLTECERLGEPAVERVPFSLIFLGPREPVLAQRIYRVEHDRLGELYIFLVPIAQDAEGTRYEAVFT